MTDGGRGFNSDPSTPPEDDLKQARIIIAGVLSEWEFDRDDFRHGSSLDEVLMYERLVANAAFKMRVDAEKLAAANARLVSATLRINAGAVKQIAVILNRERKVEGKKLRGILARMQRREVVWEFGANKR